MVVDRRGMSIFTLIATIKAHEPFLTGIMFFHFVLRCVQIVLIPDQ